MLAQADLALTVRVWPTGGNQPLVSFPLRATQQVWIPRILVHMGFVVSGRADECWENMGAGGKENCYLI